MKELLAADYIRRAKIRAKIIKEFFKERDYADVIRVSQEIVELVEKAILLKMGIVPPKWHDVIDVILETKEKLPEEIGKKISKLRRGAKWLRSQREIAFYGDEDFLPLKEYTLKDAKKAYEIAKKFLEIAEKI